MVCVKTRFLLNVCVVYRYAYVCTHYNPEPPARESDRERVGERVAARERASKCAAAIYIERARQRDKGRERDTDGHTCHVWELGSSEREREKTR